MASENSPASPDFLARLPTLERLAVRAHGDPQVRNAQRLARLATQLGLEPEEVTTLARRGLALIEEMSVE